MAAAAPAIERRARHLPAPSAAEEQTVLDLFAKGKLPEAERLARRMTHRFPRHLFAWKVLAAVLASSARWDEAIPLYGRLQPALSHDWQFLNNFGNALKSVGRPEEAMLRYNEATALDSTRLEPHYNLGLACIDLGEYARAEQALDSALRLDPAHGLAHLNLANILNLQGRLHEAEMHYLQARKVMPTEARLLNNLGQLYGKQRRYPEAEGCYRAAIELDAGYATPVSNLAELLATHGHVADAVFLLRHAVALDPTHAQAHSNLLFTLAHEEFVTPDLLLQEHQRFAERFEPPLQHAHVPTTFDRNPDRVLRVGFISADLRSHPLMRYLPRVLEILSRRSDISLHAYSNNAQQDTVTDRYRSLFAGWRNVFHLSDEALAAQIRADAMDILIDLSGHTGHNRLLALARKPAPIQVSWMGYPMSTGLQSIDYFVADRHLVPPEHEDLFTETLLFLPAATTFDPHPDAPEVSALPAMQSGTFTFACLARANKLNRTLIRTWVSILRAVPNSRLLLAAMPDGSAPQAVLQWFAAQGFTPADLRTRLAFAHIRNVEELLALHSQIDLALDTFPYTGSTSSSHALWMGVPTLTIAGDTTVGRMGAALALHVGLPEFIASDPEAYVRRAIEFARAPSSLAELRPQLRARFSASALQQHEHHATAVAEELRAVWRRWCASQPASW